MAALVVAAPAAADHKTTYPIGANSFASSAEGWSDIEHDCVLVALPGVVCSVENEHAGAIGTPPGSLHASMNSAAQLLTLFSGTSRWRSPSFTIDPTIVPQAVAGTLTLDKFQETTGALLDQGSEANTTVLLVDEAAPDAPTTLLTNDQLPPATEADPWQTASQPVAADKLTPGKTYHLVILTEFTGLVQAALGTIHAYYDNVAVVLDSAVAPEATTGTAAPLGSATAQFSGTVDPNGLPATYHYEYGLVAGPDLISTPNRSAGSGDVPVSPLHESVGALQPDTQYRVRIVASTAEGSDTGDFVVFRTEPVATQGPQGAPGTSGTGTGTAGQGVQGAGGAGGGPTSIVINNGDERALMNIRAGTLILGTVGRRAGIIRMRVFCSEKVGKICAGTIKIRSANRIQPATRKPKRKLRRVTFVTEEYQLQQGRTGYAILELSPEKIDKVKQLKSLLVTIEMQVTDALGNRQTIIKRARMKVGRSA